MKLYTFALSPHCRRVVAVCRHLGLEPEAIVVDLGQGAQRDEDYRAINPNGLVPTLVDDETVLWESNAIIAYLAGRNTSPLWPDSMARYEIIKWQSWNEAHLAPPCRDLMIENLFKPMQGHEPDEEVVARSSERVRRFGRVLDQHLDGRSFIVGAELTLADFSLAAFLDLGADAELPLDDFGHVRAWLARMRALPAWRDSAP
ncbi:MAG: glutathione S-transferase family protein [Myxococcota bacterium]